MALPSAGGSSTGPPSRGINRLVPELDAAARFGLLREGVECFAASEYFAAHEAFEEVWRSTTPAPRDLLQSLAQASAALYNALILGRLKGAARTLAKARIRLATRPTVELGLDLATLAVDLARWQIWLEAGGVDDQPPAPRLLLVVPDDLR